MVIRASGERLHVKGRAAGPGDPSGSVLMSEHDQIQLGGVTLALERLTADRLKEEEVEEEAAAVVEGFAPANPSAGSRTSVTGGAADLGGTASSAVAAARARPGGITM